MSVFQINRMPPPMLSVFLASYRVEDVALMHMEMSWKASNHMKITYKKMILRSMGLTGMHMLIKEFRCITHFTIL